MRMVEVNTIMSIDDNLEEYDLIGYLNGMGKIHFWKEVDRAMKKFDLNDISLKSRGSSKSTKTMDKPSGTERGRKLPTPPSRRRLFREKSCTHGSTSISPPTHRPSGDHTSSDRHFEWVRRHHRARKSSHHSQDDSPPRKRISRY